MSLSDKRKEINVIGEYFIPKDVKEFIKNKKITPEELHNWYLEVTRKINPESFNEKAQKPYKDLTEEQKFIDIIKQIKYNK